MDNPNLCDMRKSIQHVLPNPGDIACKYVDDPWSQIVMIRMTPIPIPIPTIDDDDDVLVLPMMPMITQGGDVPGSKTCP